MRRSCQVVCSAWMLNEQNDQWRHQTHSACVMSLWCLLKQKEPESGGSLWRIKKTRGFEIYRALVEKCPGPSPSVSSGKTGPHISCAGVWLLVYWPLDDKEQDLQCLQLLLLECLLRSWPRPITCAQRELLLISSVWAAFLCCLPAGPLCPEFFILV